MVLFALIAAVTAVSSSPWGAVRLPGPFDEDDVLRQRCREWTPVVLSVAGVSDPGHAVDLEILVLLDGISK